MLSLAFCLLTFGQATVATAIPPQNAKIFAGPWAVTANGQPGEFVVRIGKGNQVYGEIFTGLWTGTFLPSSGKIEFTRRERQPNGEYLDVQAYTGELTLNADTARPGSVLKGTFKSLAGPGWGTPGVEYAWRAEAIPPPDRDAELKGLQGEWEVIEAQGEGITAAEVNALLDAAHLTKAHEKLTIRGNELVRDGKVLATVANDLFIPDSAGDLGPAQRHPLMITLPTGKGVLCAYGLRPPGVLEIVYPHSMGRVGRGRFLWLKRADRPAAP